MGKPKPEIIVIISDRVRMRERRVRPPLHHDFTHSLYPVSSLQEEEVATLSSTLKAKGLLMEQANDWINHYIPASKGASSTS